MSNEDGGILYLSEKGCVLDRGDKLPSEGLTVLFALGMRYNDDERTLGYPNGALEAMARDLFPDRTHLHPRALPVPSLLDPKAILYHDDEVSLIIENPTVSSSKTSRFIGIAHARSYLQNEDPIQYVAEGGDWRQLADISLLENL